MADTVRQYDSSYASFGSAVQADVRHQTFGEDIGQNSWLSADECREFISWLSLDPQSDLLEIASGSGGPALFVATVSGCGVTGIDISPAGVANANDMAKSLGLEKRVRFELANAAEPLKYDAGQFDAILCNDAINHLPDRPRILADWYRALKPGGRLLFTDPITVTGLLSSEEIAVRSLVGYLVFTPPDEDSRLVAETGFTLMRREDRTENVALISKRWLEARIVRRDDLIQIEGLDKYEGMQRFFEMVYRLSSERRLSRFAYLAVK